jgi:NIMA (never in mitosis gene a)-related kinase
MYLIIILILVLLNLNYKEGYWNRKKFLQRLHKERERLRLQEEQRLQTIRNWFLQRERERIERQRQQVLEAQRLRRIELERIERERIQAQLDEERTLRLIEEQKKLEKIKAEEDKGILTSYTYIHNL